MNASLLHVRRGDLPAVLGEVVAGAGWSSVSVRSGIEGTRGETWLELSAARDEVSR